MVNINDYTPIVGQGTIDELFLLAQRLQGKIIQNINSTAVGGGVAEILTRIIPLLRQLGVDARWDVIKGNERFFGITKKIHNALHGVNIEISPQDLEYFLETNRDNAQEMNLYGDILFIHDSQPIALVEKKKEIGKKWLWRCHVDFTRPKQDIMNFLRSYIEKYDAVVFSAPPFAIDINLPQVLISPSIDPLSDKNKELPPEIIAPVLERFGIDKSRPIITQISRFDYLKDPVGVIKAYKMCKKHIDCQLILAGGGATDDPEGLIVLEEVKSAAADDPDVHILLLPPASDIEINALQRASTVILQKSLKEGFGLTVAEALWKAKPVIAGAVGGIPIQITHKYSGILTHSIEGTAYYLKQLINEPEYAKRLGENGREHIKNNFLITRHLRDYLLLFLSLYYEGDIIYL
ncbi:glycosyl transferase family 1 [Candidatus Desantisbacteria bacterium CG2_30_40_21]|uniref:Glycosyl transferase family 1 n=5 Tax=unclassified Candidatus Desantisiibacteriota TaxID=3106372 RepID=A0A2M7J968_9BACT|nr:MAG: glycosyl transferase family 1 [Candidatus Desantisbacteria bacterium CG2_30_40_21]PIP40627.1 MAG: glycosyl transferase family 1 [Candidatus Desantisbacteria bacterium CG23_combo_of_CG06-09_8_20_14_all_40_23]PIX15901.1 MAG: glycosyl transferase family 1 [Candidatus Desantisbacteria bacterium CG_4_8_14_3_um_filter_40_12]PIY19438.1 MAG: glycosyl transferase family 1 [Candidatus Desantisbacteria bacterium CG_4_10_14_3_um_filter_40_18]PJB28273.1 MAG: glycosyl transferase family 1 [Candidatus